MEGQNQKRLLTIWPYSKEVCWPERQDKMKSTCLIVAQELSWLTLVSKDRDTWEPGFILQLHRWGMWNIAACFPCCAWGEGEAGKESTYFLEASSSRPSHRTLVVTACWPRVCACARGSKRYCDACCQRSLHAVQFLLNYCIPPTASVLSLILSAYSSFSCGHTIPHWNGPITVWLLQQGLTPGLNVCWLGNNCLYLVPAINPISP